MEIEEEDKINNFFNLIKEYKSNKESFIKDYNLNLDIISALTNEDNNKDDNIKYKLLKVTKIYIINRQPLDELMKRLNFKDYENLLNQDDNAEENEMKIKNKIKDFIGDNSFIDLDSYTKDLVFYHTEEEIKEIFEKNLNIIFVKEDLLKALEIDPMEYKNKEVYFIKNKNVILIWISKTASYLINLSSLFTGSISNNINPDKNDSQIKNNLSGSNNINIINENENDKEKEKEGKKETDDKKGKKGKGQKNKNNINIINENKINSKEEKIEDILNKNLGIVSHHLNHLNSIYTLESLDINDLNDINQIENIINNNYGINCLLMDSEIFGKFKESIYYEDCENLLLLDEGSEKKQKTSELIEKMKKEKKKIDNKMQIINGYEECTNLINKNNDIQFMLIDINFFEVIEIDKNIDDKSNVSVFNVKDGLFLYFKDKKKIMKVFYMNKYFKLNINIEKEIDVPKNIVDDLVLLYEQTRKINDSIDDEIKKNDLKNYYIINKNWLNQYKNYYNYEQIVVKYQEYYDIENEEVSEQNYNNNTKNIASIKQDLFKGLSNNQKKKLKKKMKKQQNNWQKNTSNTTVKKKEKKPEIKVQYTNIEYPKFLLDENNILPKYNDLKNYPYPVEFDLIEIQTFKNLCNHLKISINSKVLDKISFKALLGDSKIFLQSESIDTLFEIFNSKGINNILEYLIIYDDKNMIKKEIDIIKTKGFDKYLTDMGLKFDDDSLQYLIDQKCTTTIGKIYLANIKPLYEINNNENNKINIIDNYYGNNNINNNNINNNNYQYSFSQIEQISPCRLGLDNIGATCYMNATLQCLCNIVQLQNYFLNNNQIFQNPHAKLSKAFCDVLQNLYNFKKNKKSFSPNNFKNLIGDMNNLFKGVAANDSKDLILFIYEKIHEELNSPNNCNNYEPNISYELQLFRQNYYSNNSSIIEKTFYYEQETINQCSSCGNKIINYNIQNIIIFPLEKIRLNLLQSYPDGFPYVYLEECFAQISLPELMDGPNCI